MHAGRATGRAAMTGGGSNCGPAAGSVTVDLASAVGAVLRGRIIPGRLEFGAALGTESLCVQECHPGRR
jgi:hypothetical protein